MRYAILAAALALAACDGGWPELGDLYRVQGDTVMCDDVSDRTDGPLEVVCTWENVEVHGQPHCYAAVVFSRDAETDPWTESVFTSDAACR